MYERSPGLTLKAGGRLMGGAVAVALADAVAAALAEALAEAGAERDAEGDAREEGDAIAECDEVKVGSALAVVEAVAAALRVAVQEMNETVALAEVRADALADSLETGVDEGRALPVAEEDAGAALENAEGEDDALITADAELDTDEDCARTRTTSAAQRRAVVAVRDRAIISLCEGEHKSRRAGHVSGQPANGKTRPEGASTSSSSVATNAFRFLDDS